ncbi:Atrial natriuretic peptide receptor 1 [Hypsibius exemplaris]|uniref:guanylate cyclase n=1 Tax=Hypsibius exemplaris TaxID=2072580 RepID=A0A1W0WCK0_HYPEX|nr:Atrial natriuretic peptide receptor 1 [Hypsibius exemplaris]
MLSSTPVVIRLMRLMRDLGLFQPGSHVFIVLQPTEQVSYGPASLFAFPKEEDKNLFRSVLYLTSFTPAGDESVALNDVLANRSQVLYGTTLEDGFKPLDLAPVQATFNSAYIFATLVNDSKNAEGAGRLNDAQLCNGRRLRSLMVNRTFAFPGGPVYIDPLGYSHVGFVVLASNHERGNYQIVGRYDSFQQIYIWDPQTRLEWVGTGPPADVPLCGFSGREGICKDQERSMAVTIGAAIVGALAAILLICTVLLIRRAQVQNRQTRPWVLSAAEFKLSGTQQLDETYLSAEIDGRCAFRGRDVWISTVGISPKTHILDHRMVTLGDLLFACHQNNVNQFLGLIIHPANSSLLFVEEFGGKGSLRDLINNGSINREFQKSFVQDLIQGLHFIHTSKFRKHGRLTSLCCIIDSHFVLKISKLGHEHLRDLDGSTVAHNRNPVSPEFSIWSPPALSQSAGRVTDSKADIYALGIILYELFTSLDVSEIAYHLSEKLATQRFCSPLVPDDLLGWIVRCSSEDPFQRPSIEQVLKVLFAKLQIRKQDNLMSRTMRRLETYANDLEDKVNERTKDLLEQRRLCDSLLEEMLPRVIVERLRAHEDVTPRMFDSVTVYFSDIDGFGDYALANTPYDVISFLNQVYSTLDVLISQFDVYKVETINDSYVVVSGIPIPNGSHHASAVAFMALSFLRAYSESNFRRQTRLRVGMHSGPVAAGVVGHRSPRYCLFGDTMNTASRMESHGEPGRIHVSPKTAEFLKEVPQLQLTPRGTVTIIGKGQMETFWLEASQPLEPFC